MAREAAWQVDVPPGWEPVAGICSELFSDRERITEHINARIRQEVEQLRDEVGPLSRSDLSWSTGGGVEHFLRGVAERRHASERDLSFQRLVGQRSAMRGVPLQPLITAYHVGFRELWSILAQRAKGGPAADLLLERGSIVWERLGATATAVSQGYQEEMARREATGATATAHLLEALDADPSSDEAVALARDLGLDPSGESQVLAIGGAAGAGLIASTVATALRAAGAVAAITQQGRTAVVIAQGASPETLDRVMRVLPPGTAAGLGSAAPGLAGIPLSRMEAERALAVGVRRAGVSRFEDEWLLTAVFSQLRSAQRILGGGIAVAGAEPHLVEAVRAFARSGFSVAESARAMSLSPNSVRYRLSRWRDLTGWDPWTYDGLMRSMIAIDLGDTVERPA